MRPVEDEGDDTMKLVNADDLFIHFLVKGQKNERKKYKIGENWELNGKEIREVIENLPAIDIKVIEEEAIRNAQLRPNLYGYDLEEMRNFCMMCRALNITPDEIRTFMSDTGQLYMRLKKQVDDEFNKAMKEMFGDNEI